MESATLPHSSNGDDDDTDTLNTLDPHPYPYAYPDSNSNSNTNTNTNTIKPEIITTYNSLPKATENGSPITSHTSTTSITSPPYWSHTRPISHASVESIDPSGITLQDNTTEGDEGDASGKVKNEACWARSVVIEDYVVVNGGAGRMGIGGGMGVAMGISNIGAFVVWNVRVDTLEGTPITIRKRYSEFADLRGKLLRTFPNSAVTIPELPRKSVISKFRPKFLENRRRGLQYFLNCILLNPEFTSSPVLKEFLFS